MEVSPRENKGRNYGILAKPFIINTQKRNSIIKAHTTASKEALYNRGTVLGKGEDNFFIKIISKNKLFLLLIVTFPFIIV